MQAPREQFPRPARPWIGLVAVLLQCAAMFLLFCAVDRRPPDDHDDFYTANSHWAVQDFLDAGLRDRPRVLWDHFRSGELHPRFAQTVLVASLGTFGRSRFVFRATNLPFLLLLVLGTWLLAREFGSDRMALLAAFVVANLPVVINYSRKWDIQFHAASLTPVGLWLALAALRAGGRRASLLWIAFGAWQGLRLYSHPIVLPDIAMTLLACGVLLVPCARAAGRAGAPALLRFGAGILAFAVVGLYYSGLARALLGEPAFSMRRYVMERGSYSDPGWWLDSDFVAKVSHLHDLLAEAIWLYLMPLDTVLLLPGLLLLPLLLLLRRAWTEQPPASRWRVLLVLFPAAAQAPAAALGTSNRAYLSDWLFLVPGLAVLAILSLRLAARALGDGERRWVRIWAYALVTAGLLHHAIPLSGRCFVSDPIADHLPWENLVLGPFIRSSSGRAYTTHHVPTSFQFAGEALARTVVRLEPDRSVPARFVMLDLTYDPAHEGSHGCRLGDPASPAAWSWDPPPSLNVWLREVSPWPFVFEGFPGMRSVRPDHTVDPAASAWAVVRPTGMVDPGRTLLEDGELTQPILGGDEERAAGTAIGEPHEQVEEIFVYGPPVLEKPERLPRTAVVRLWLVLSPFWERETWDCRPDERLPEGFFDAARARVEERFPGVEFLGPLPDPSGWLIARVVEWDRTRSHGGTALLYDLRDYAGKTVTSANEINLEGDGDLRGNLSGPEGGGQAVQPVEAVGEHAPDRAP